MKLQFPKVSVVISTYNRPKMLWEAIESVLNQTFRNFELIVVDDASNTAEKIGMEMKMRGMFDGIQYAFINMDENSGYQCAPKNVGIQHARGSYIAYLDDDNLWDEDHLEHLVKAIEREGVDLVYSRWRYEGDGPMSGKETQFIPPSQEAIVALLDSPMNNFIDTSSILHSKAAVVGMLGSAPWNTEVHRFADWYLIGSCIQAGLQLYAVDKVSFTYRWHGENIQLTRPVTKKEVYLTNKFQPKWKGLKETVA